MPNNAAATVLARATCKPRTPTVKRRESIPAACAETMKATAAPGLAPVVTRPKAMGRALQLHKGLINPRKAPLATGKCPEQRISWTNSVGVPALTTALHSSPSKSHGLASPKVVHSSVKNLVTTGSGGLGIRGLSHGPSSSSSHPAGCLAFISGTISTSVGTPIMFAAFAQQLSWPSPGLRFSTMTKDQMSKRPAKAIAVTRYLHRFTPLHLLFVNVFPDCLALKANNWLVACGGGLPSAIKSLGVTNVSTMPTDFFPDTDSGYPKVHHKILT